MDPHNPRPAKREPEEEVTDHRERGPVEELETQELIWRVRAALTNPALTPEQERLASLLLSEATTSEIADALDIEGTSPLSNVNNKVQRLYRKLRQLIEIE
jgi:DNA-binding CsgD family transcriptional regulator